MEALSPKPNPKPKLRPSNPKPTFLAVAACGCCSLVCVSGWTGCGSTDAVETREIDFVAGPLASCLLCSSHQFSNAIEHEQESG